MPKVLLYIGDKEEYSVQEVSKKIDISATSMTLKPDTILGVRPRLWDNREEMYFQFTSTIESNTFEYKLDSGDWIPTKFSDASFKTLEEGPHTFLVRATSPGLDGTDITPAFWDWTIDRTPPVINVSYPEDNITTGLRELNIQGTIQDNLSPDIVLTINGMLTPLTANNFTKQVFLANGENLFSFVATDLAGNTSTLSLTINSDQISPETSITNTPPSLSNSSSASFGFSSNENNSTFQCKVDGSSWNSCSSPRVYSGLSDGEHTFYVRATDAYQNLDATPSEYTWTIDTIPPVVSLPVKPDLVSLDKDPSFSIVSESISDVIEYKLDSGNWIPYTGDVFFSGLSNSSHTFFYKSTDLAGNTATLEYTWEIAYLELSFSLAPKTSIVYSTSSDFIFSSNDASTVFEFNLDSSEWVPSLPAKSLGMLSVGSHEVLLRGTNTSGNTSLSSVSFTWSITRLPVLVTSFPIAKVYNTIDPELLFDSSPILEPLKGLLGRDEGSDVGVYNTNQGTVTNANNPSYDITFASCTLTITREPVIVTADNKVYVVNTTQPDLTFTVIPDVALVGSLDREVGETIGSYAILQGTVTNENNPNFNITFIQGILKIRTKCPSWSVSETINNKAWTGATMSNDGVKGAFSADEWDGIWTTADGGKTWTQIPHLAGSPRFGCICGSADGTFLAAGRMSTAGSIYTSFDSGATWTEKAGLGAKQFSWIHTPKGGDGQRLITSGNSNTSNDYMFASNDFGETWSAITAKGPKYYMEPIISQDGTTIYTGVYNDYAYRSVDSGVTWEQQGILRGRTCLDGSSDLKYMIQGIEDRDVLYSSDYGITWTNFNSVLGWDRWRTVGVSEDGQTLFAGGTGDGYKGGMYTSTDAGLTWERKVLDLYASGGFPYYNGYITPNGKHIVIPTYSADGPWFYTGCPGPQPEITSIGFAGPTNNPVITIQFNQNIDPKTISNENLIFKTLGTI